ncbi:hypothetical protein AD15_0456 [Escherichia coli 3-105-05_S4_C2]|nr:hypothetical protein AD15_0456 [Escherichia coli 3-105-05_S4_C2]
MLQKIKILITITANMKHIKNSKSNNNILYRYIVQTHVFKVK